jgi:hypothetical protein
MVVAAATVMFMKVRRRIRVSLDKENCCAAPYHGMRIAGNTEP